MGQRTQTRQANNHSANKPNPSNYFPSHSKRKGKQKGHEMDTPIDPIEEVI